MPASSGVAPSTRSSETLVGPASPFLVTGPQSLQPENPLDVILKGNSQHHHLKPALLVPAPAVNYRFSDNPVLHGYLHPAPSYCLSALLDLPFLTAGSDTKGTPALTHSANLWAGFCTETCPEPLSHNPCYHVVGDRGSGWVWLPRIQLMTSVEGKNHY